MFKIALLGCDDLATLAAQSLEEAKSEEIVVVDNPAEADLLLIDANDGDLFPGPEEQKWVALVSGCGQQLTDTVLGVLKAGASWAYFRPETGPQIVRLLLDLERIFRS